MSSESPPAAANLLGQPAQTITVSSDLLGGDFQRPASELLTGGSFANNNSAARVIASQAARPASEIINKSYKSPEAEAIDRLYEDLSYYERTLEEMAQARLDDNFREELKAIEQWFSVLSNCERTTALYSLLQQATPVQIRFFITVLQQMAQKETPGNTVDKTHERDYLYPPRSPGVNSRKFYPRHSAPIEDFDFQKRANEENVYHHPHHDDTHSYKGNRRGSTHSLKGKEDNNTRPKSPFDLEMTQINGAQGWALNNFTSSQTSPGSSLRERTSSLQQQQAHHNNPHPMKNGIHVTTKRSFNKISSPKSPAFPKPLSPLIVMPTGNDNKHTFNDIPPVSPGGSNKWGSSSNRGGYAHSEYSDVDDDGNSRRNGSQYHRAGSTAGSTTAGSVSGKDKGKIPDQIELELLEDIPTWLRSLRLHKYTSIFENMPWKEMVVLTDEELTTKGVAALGARRKLLKVFSMVKAEAEKQNIELPKSKESETATKTIVESDENTEEKPATESKPQETPEKTQETSEQQAAPQQQQQQTAEQTTEQTQS